MRPDSAEICAELFFNANTCTKNPISPLGDCRERSRTMPVEILTDKADSTEHGSESGRSLVLTFSQTTLMCADAHDDTRIMPPNDKTERCGRPSMPALTPDVARPHSLQ